MSFKCPDLAHSWLTALQDYWNALEGIRVGKPMARGRAALAHKQCKQIIEIAREQRCDLKTFDGYGDGVEWERRAGPKLPFE